MFSSRVVQVMLPINRWLSRRAAPLLLSV